MTLLADLFHTDKLTSNNEIENLADKLYHQGWEFEHSDHEPRKAAKYYRLAACEGHKPAQTALAMLYLRGDGVPENRELAREWLVKADQLKLLKLVENY